MSLKIETTQRPTQDIIDLLENTVYGTPGKTRFQHTGVEKKIRTLPNPYFLTLRKNARLLGVANLNLKDQTLSPVLASYYYIRYFSLFDLIRTKSPVKKKRPTKNRIKDQIITIFRNGGFTGPNEKAVFFAYIEMENERSKAMTTSLGFTPLGRLNTFLFSRFFPKRHNQVIELPLERRENTRKALQNFYSKYTMYDPAYLFKHGSYFVFMEDNEIVAGIQAVKTVWKVKEVPGWSGRLLYFLLPKLPLLSRVFDPENYSFLAVDYLYVKRGHEKALNALLESACSIMGLNNAMVWADQKSPLHSIIKDNVKLGLLDKLHKSVPGQIVVRFAGLEDSEQQMVRDSPAFISSFDLT